MIPKIRINAISSNIIYINQEKNYQRNLLNLIIFNLF
jgi:hypothetical protein